MEKTKKINTFNQMKLIYLFIVVFYSITMLSQEIQIEKVNLNWSEKESFRLEKGKTWYMPMVENNSINVNTKLPDFNKKWKVAKNTKVLWHEIKNIKYKTISKNSLFDIAYENIPREIQSSMQVVSTREDFDVFFNLTPLINTNGQVKQIISFEIHYKLTIDKDSSSIKSYALNSVLATGSWYKFSIDKTGVYKLDYNFLKNIGIDVKNVNPSRLSIYGNGGGILPYRIGDPRYDDLQENAIVVTGESDGKFDNNDYILFYARGPERWKHDGNIESLRHLNNIYSDKAYYFVHVKNQAAKRINLATEISSISAITFTNYDDYIVHELEKKNLFHMGQSWVGEAFGIENEQTISMNFTNLDTSAPLTIRTKVVASSSDITYMQVKANEIELYNIKIPTTSKHVIAREGVGVIDDLLLNNDNIDIKLTYDNSGNPSSEAFLDYIEIIGKKNLIANGKQFSFRNFETIGNNTAVKFSIQNNTNIDQVWDVTDPINPKKLTNQGSNDTFDFLTQGGDLKEFVLINQQDYYTPESSGNTSISNQNLHALRNIDYVIITQDFLINEAQVLAQYHINNSDLNTVVVPLHQIYNEFGSGSADITAIRDFIKFLYDTSTPHLQYVMLYGDTSYDPKGIFEKEENIVPSFHSSISFSETATFVTDDYFAIVSHVNEGELDSNQIQTQDVAIGRIPVRTIKEAHDVTRKLLNYYNKETLGDWRNQILMMADDTDKEFEVYLQNAEEILADKIKDNKRVYNIKKVYADAYPQIISSGGASYPEMNKDIINTVEKGVLIANYFGHGGEDGLAYERILTTSDVESWTNFDMLPLIMIISCEFARLDNPSRPNTAGELVIRNPHGAGASHIATARAIFIDTGDILNQALIPYLLEYKTGYEDISNSIANNLRLAKNDNNDYDEKQRYFVFFLGDPAMKLAVPRPDVRITHMNGKPIGQPLDTIKALSHTRFKGIVTNKNGVIESDFNGTLFTTIYDKEIDKETLNNDGIAGIMVFDTQESKLFRGSATVTNGEFEFDFIAPKDIRIAYGKGKLSFYAHNGEIDKAGYNIDVTVGGINEDAPEDNLGPTIQLYMNDKSFIDGGTTNQSPNLLAFFQDENGINTALSAVGHDIVAVIDNDYLNPIVLNDYYATEPNNYKRGNLEYRLRNLEIGLHTLHLKVYDTYNNPGEATLNFRVLDDNELILEHVLNYPNPFVNYTEFWFNHNKPNEPLEVQIQIYTVSGKLIKTINQLIQTAGSLSKEINWDGLDDFGSKIGKGVYVYKLSVKATLSDLKAEKFEKLVILQ